MIGWQKNIVTAGRISLRTTRGQYVKEMVNIPLDFPTTYVHCNFEKSLHMVIENH